MEGKILEMRHLILQKLGIGEVVQRIFIVIFTVIFIVAGGSRRRMYEEEIVVAEVGDAGHCDG
jgi:hypothetical protein